MFDPKFSTDPLGSLLTTFEISELVAGLDDLERRLSTGGPKLSRRARAGLLIERRAYLAELNHRQMVMNLLDGGQGAAE